MQPIHLYPPSSPTRRSSDLSYLNSATLAGVTLSSGSDLVSTGGTVTVTGGLTVDGKIRINHNPSLSTDLLYLLATQTEGRAGEILYGTGTTGLVLNQTAKRL